MNIDLIYSLAGLVTVVTGWFLTESIRKKNKSDTSESLVTSAMTMLEHKQKELENAIQDLALHKEYIDYLLKGIEKLHRQLKSRKPSFKPKDILTFKMK